MMANRTMRTRILIGSIGAPLIIPGPLPVRFFGVGRGFGASLAGTLATLVLLALVISLGRWQWHRGEGKQRAWAEYEHQMTLPPVDAPARLDVAPRYLAIRLRGHFDAAHQFLLDNRFLKGNVGYEV